jgi:hypothetical protein
MSRERIDFQALNRSLLADARAMVTQWLPGGRVEGHEYLVRNPKRNDGTPGSFKINLQTGKWADFASGDRGGDLVSLFAFLRGLGQAEAARQLLGEAVVNLPPTAAARRILRRQVRAVDHPQGLTVERYASDKQLDIAFLETCGVSDCVHPQLNERVVAIEYRDPSGAVRAVRYRASKSGDASNRFLWRKGDQPLLYGLWRLDQQQRVAILAEGESDCHTLWQHGFNAVGVPGAGMWRDDRDAAALASFETIYLVIEPDEGGRLLKARLEASALRDKVSVLDLAGFKDPSALHLDGPAMFAGRFKTAMAAATPLAGAALPEGAAPDVDLNAAVEALRQEAEILERFAETIAAAGLVGEARAAKLLYLAVTTRCFSRPVSVIVKGPSSGGKSFLVERVLDFFPASAHHTLTAMSDKALAYSEEPLSHRFLVLYEAAGLKGDMAEYLVRSLLSEGRIRYETVESGANGLRPRLISREGPTGLLLTTTRLSVHPENETRLLTVTVREDPDQTRQVLQRMASGGADPPDLGAWRHMQELLADDPPTVVIPYAGQLANLVDTSAIRIRRDFSHVLALIKAHALLHKASRPVSPKGEVLANLDDYGVVRDLLCDTLAVGVGASVAPGVRAATEAVISLVPTGDCAAVTNNQVANALGRDPGGVSRHLQAAQRLGYVVDTGSGGQRQYRPGEPLPGDRSVLPLATALSMPDERD